MTTYRVDTADRTIDEDDLATWLLFYLESHGADIVLTETRAVKVNLDPMRGLDAETVQRWAPVIVKCIPAFRQMLLARPAVLDGSLQ